MRNQCQAACQVREVDRTGRTSLNFTEKTIHLETTLQPLSFFILGTYFTLNRLSDFKILMFFFIICRFLERLFERHIKQNKHHLEEVCLSLEFNVFVYAK